MLETILGLGLVALVGMVMLGGFTVVALRSYRKVNQGEALVINKTRGEPVVSFTGGLVLPIIHRGEKMEISVKSIEIDRRGHDGLICRDNIRADIKVAFFVRVNQTKEDVLKVAQAIGCVRASDQTTLEDLFVAKFSEALKTVGKRLDFEQLYTQRDDFKDQIIEVIGKDLNGYVLEDAAIDYLEQTPLSMLEKDNILDSQGIRKITEMTAAQNVKTNELRAVELKEITRQNLERDEAILELTRRRAEAEARQRREIAAVTARENAEAATIEAEEHRRAEMARIKAAEEVEIGQLGKQRQVQVADKDRERVLAIKSEQVERDRQMEVISRERDVELQRIDKEKALEIEKKAIADVVRGRIAVDKSVAEEEERIKDLRAVAEARRQKDVAVIHAEATAEESLVATLKAAEASEKAASFAARERLVAANAALEAADKEAAGKVRRAEGVQAEVAAEGLARVRVREAEAVAIEKTGGAEARVSLQRMEAEAEGAEKTGLAAARVAREQAMAEAAAIAEKGLAGVRVQEAQANAIALRGQAEADAVKSRLLAEAAGLAEKAVALQKMEGNAREHEEFRLRLEKMVEVQLATLATRREMAGAQARILAEALTGSDIKIVGGDGAFFDRFVRAISMGTSIDGFIDSSTAVRNLVDGYQAKGGDLAGDLSALVSRLDPASMRDLTLSAFLGRLAAQAEGPLRDQLAGLLGQARTLEERP